MRILLVASELEKLGLLKQSLSEADFAVDCAQDVRTTFSLVAEREYDALIVDFCLPDQNGMDLILAAMRSTWGTRPLLS